MKKSQRTVLLNLCVSALFAFWGFVGTATATAPVEYGVVSSKTDTSIVINARNYIVTEGTACAIGFDNPAEVSYSEIAVGDSVCIEYSEADTLRYADIITKFLAPHAVEFNQSGIVTAIGQTTVQIDTTTLQLTDTTRIYLKNGQIGSLSYLKIGQTVDVSGFELDGIKTVLSIRITKDIEEELIKEGTISAVGINSFVVLNKTFYVNESTVYQLNNGKKGSFADVQVARDVKVTAMKIGDSLIAKKVKFDDFSGTKLEITGNIQNYNTRFIVVDNIKFYFTDTTLVKYDDGGPGSRWQLFAGRRVTVSAISINNDYYATVITVESEIEESVEIFGMINRWSSDSLVVDGRTFLVNNDTKVFWDNAGKTDKSSIAVGQMVEVKGQLIAGAYYAKNVIINNAQYTRSIEVADTISARGMMTITVSGINFGFSPVTKVYYEKGDSTNFSELTIGKFVKISAVYVNDEYIAKQILIPTSLKTKPVYGYVTQINDSLIKINGLTVMVTYVTKITHDNGKIGKFTDLAVGSYLELKYTEVAGLNIADAIEIKKSVYKNNVDLSGVVSGITSSKLLINSTEFNILASTVFESANGSVITIDQIPNQALAIAVGHIVMNNIYLDRLSLLNDTLKTKPASFNKLESAGEMTVIVGESAYRINAQTKFYDFEGEAIDYATIKQAQYVTVTANISQGERIANEIRMIYVQPSSVVENVDALGIKFGPNPVKNELRIEFNSATLSGITEMVVNDASGTVVKRNTIELGIGANYAVVDFSSLNSGAYYISIISEGKLIAVVPVVK